jgi:CRP/FNR family transcriptional regulator
MPKRTALESSKYRSQMPAALGLPHGRIGSELREAFGEIGRVKLLPQGTEVFSQGRTPAGVFLLRAGRVKVFANGKGRQVLLQTAKPGEILGLSAAISGRPYEFTAQTAAPSSVVFVGCKDFARFMRRHPGASLQIAQVLSRKVTAAYRGVRRRRQSTGGEDTRAGK